MAQAAVNRSGPMAQISRGDEDAVRNSRSRLVLRIDRGSSRILSVERHVESTERNLAVVLSGVQGVEVRYSIEA
jgi:hypothetical protein